MLHSKSSFQSTKVAINRWADSVFLLLLLLLLLSFFFSQEEKTNERTNSNNNKKNGKQSAAIMAFLIDRYLIVGRRDYWPNHSNSSIYRDQSQKWHIKFRPILLLSHLIEFVCVCAHMRKGSNKQTIFRVSVLIFYPFFFVSILMLHFIYGIDWTCGRSGWVQCVEENDDFFFRHVCVCVCLSLLSCCVFCWFGPLYCVYFMLSFSSIVIAWMRQWSMRIECELRVREN